MFPKYINTIISVLLICSFTIVSIIPVFAEEEIRTDHVHINATVLPHGIFIPPVSPEVGPGGTTPDIENPNEDNETVYQIPFSIAINDDKFSTNSKEVILNLSAKRAAQVALSNNKDFDSASWEDFGVDQKKSDDQGFIKVEKEWTLLDGNPAAPYGVMRTVYAKFRSKEGGTTETVSDSILLDTVAPSNVSDFTVEQSSDKDSGSGSYIFLSWKNPLEKDFSKVRIFRSAILYPKLKQNIIIQCFLMTLPKTILLAQSVRLQ